MKSLILGLLATASLGGTATSGPNAGGTIFLHDAHMLFSYGDQCGLGDLLTSCEAADVQLEGSSELELIKLYAAFPETGSPRLRGLAFGISYPVSIQIIHWGPCPAESFQLSDGDWPQSDTGISIVFPGTLTEHLVEVGWFAGYQYGDPGVFELVVDDVHGAAFGDDSMPPLVDDIAGFGAMGFGMNGWTACPDNLPFGACCVGEECTVMPQVDCEGDFMGDGTTCDPNPCLPNSSVETSWGWIKVLYRN